MSLIDLFSNPDLQLNLIAEAIGVVTEAGVVYLIISRVLASRENKRWRPARLNVARMVFGVQRNFFNSLRRILDPNFHIDKKLHHVPEQASQDEADYWGKSVFLRPMEPDLDKLKKLVEYNNSALDSILMPLVSDFLISAENLLNTTKFLLEAHNPANSNIFSTSVPCDDLRKMEGICKSILKYYPEIVTEISENSFEVLSAEEMIELFNEASKKNARINLLNPNPG